VPRRVSIPDGSVIGLAVLLVGVTWFLLHQARGTTFFFDEWNLRGSRYPAMVTAAMGISP